MKIECILHREGGTKVDFGSTEYHFMPQACGAHIADVSVEEHVEAFLAIPEAYKIFAGELKAKAPAAETKKAGKKAAKEAPPALIGSTVHDASYTIGGTTYPLGDIVARAHGATGLSIEEWNEMAEEDRHARIDMALDDLAEAAEKQ